MRPSPIIFAALVVFALTGCASTTEPTATATPTPSATATPSATPSADVIAPGALPPSAFGGSCDGALTSGEVSDIVGQEFSFTETATATTVANVGGLDCLWTAADGVTASLTVLPRAGIGDATFPEAQHDYYFENCDTQWVCSWEWESDAAWMSGTFHIVPGMTRELVDAWGAALGDLAGDRILADADWTRDETGWWTQDDCAAAAAAVTTALGTTLTGEHYGYIDPPKPAILLSDPASNAMSCAMTSASGASFTIHAVSGGAWAMSEFADAPVIDSPVPGVQVRLDPRFESVDGAGYFISDGTNSLNLAIMAAGGLPLDDVARAVAEAAASGWQ